MKDKIIKLKIPCQSDRENIIIALANSGYMVWVEEVNSRLKREFYICFNPLSKLTR